MLRKTANLLLATFLAMTAAEVRPTFASGRIYVTSYNSSGNFKGPVGEYDSATGATINATLVSGLFQPQGVATSGANLFVTDTGDGNSGHGTIKEYDTTGATVNAALVSGLSTPTGIAISGANLFVTESSRVGQYDAATGPPSTPTLSPAWITPRASRCREETCLLPMEAAARLGSTTQRRGRRSTPL